MAYSKQDKEKALNLIKAGVPITEVAKDLNISRATLSNWVRKSKDEDIDTSSIENIKKQIATLSKRSPTEATAKKLAMLTNSLNRLEKKQKKTVKKKKQNIVYSADVQKYRSMMLKVDYGLYEYQREFIRDTSRFRVWLKSRQIGATYGCAGECLVDAMSGMDQLILSASETQALKWYAEIYKHAEKLGLILEGSVNEIKVPSGATIYIFANNFRTIQGFSGSVWMDEFAWYLNPKRIWEAFIPSITSVKAGVTKARITILSTPFEQDSLFHKLCEDTQKYYMFSRHKTTIYDAVKLGLDVDIQVLKDLFDADSWAMMYECIFADDDSSFFPIKLIKSCVKDYMYYTPSYKNVLWSGYDIGRSKHLSVLSALERKEDKYILAICDIFKNATFESQKTVIKEHLNLYLKANMRIDKTGIGMDLAEGMERSYPSRVEGISFTASSKEYMTLNLKKMFEDKTIVIPNDPYLIADIHSIKRKAGAKKMIYFSKEDKNGHADRFWSLALAVKKLDFLGRENADNKGGAVIL